eukprot:NODE_9492_length_1421_cov_2.595054.p1 GENE.NODE_9492_length_1421_cov_2.595054~~NODE_9492_length_1421_cov_2.595054.p1  ORF type:complete len:312 (-),score=101.52 NODE_9492_length_1421_cov_2.595054:484-1332(-)
MISKSGIGCHVDRAPTLDILEKTDDLAEMSNLFDTQERLATHQMVDVEDIYLDRFVARAARKARKKNVQRKGSVDDEVQKRWVVEAGEGSETISWINAGANKDESDDVWSAKGDASSVASAQQAPQIPTTRAAPERPRAPEGVDAAMPNMAKRPAGTAANTGTRDSAVTSAFGGGVRRKRRASDVGEGAAASDVFGFALALAGEKKRRNSATGSAVDSALTDLFYTQAPNPFLSRRGDAGSAVASDDSGDSINEVASELGDLFHLPLLPLSPRLLPSLPPPP